MWGSCVKQCRAWKGMKGKVGRTHVSRPNSAKTVQTSRSPLTASADRAIAIKRLAADMITDGRFMLVASTVLDDGYT